MTLYVKQLHNLGHAPLSDLPNFISPKAVWKTISQISPHQSLPPYGTYELAKTFHLATQYTHF